MKVYVDNTLLNKLPKKYHNCIVWLEKCDRVYFLTMLIDGIEISATVDTLKELNWACKYIVENKEFNF